MTIVFQISCAAGVQGEFERAVALLHLCWYDAAAHAFGKVARRDPTCAMAQWGLAMTAMGDPTSGSPSPEALAAGWRAAQAAMAMGARTPREDDYIAAVASFYRGGTRAIIGRARSPTSARWRRWLSAIPVTGRPASSTRSP